MTHRNINLKSIRIDGNTQSRAALDPVTVAEYAEVLKAGGELPPVVLFNDGVDHWMAEGFHRFHAYQADGRASIPADVRVGTQRDARLFSCGANAQHGLRRTNEDKRHAVGLMLADAEWSKMSDRDIAKHCSVSHTFVAIVRNPKPPAPPPAPKPGAGKGTPSGGDAAPTAPAPPPAGGGNVATPPAPAPTPEAPPPPGPTEAERAAEEAHGGTDLAELLEETQAEVAKLQKQIEAAEADDAKAEAMKWQRISSIATRRQNELQETVKERDRELLAMTKIIDRIGRAVGEEDRSKVAATVEAFVRHARVAA